MDNDRALLRAWSTQHDESAFATLVRRYTPLVWSSSRRRLPDAASADDATQVVFLLLARRAPHLLQRPWWGATTVADWLHRTSIGTAANARRALARRHNHERQVANDINDMMHAQSPNSEPSDEWTETLDDALRTLSSRYREPLIMHYLAARPRAEIARELGVSEDAIHKRIERGLDQLRSRLGVRAMGALMLLPSIQQTQGHHLMTQVLSGVHGLPPASQPLITSPMPWMLTKVTAVIMMSLGVVTALWWSLTAPGAIRAGSVPDARAMPQQAAARASRDPVEIARDHGLSYLLGQQKLPAGTWNDGQNSEVAITALVIRTLDTFPNPTPGLLRARSRALESLAQRARDHQGLLADSSMQTYTQALGTLVLGEHLHELPDGTILLQQAAAILLDAQSALGGWRYTLQPKDADLSVTGDVVLALTQAQRQGACDARRALARAQSYLQGCFEPESGGFTYTPVQPAHPLPTSDMPAVHPPRSGQTVQSAYRIALGSLAMFRISGTAPTIDRAHVALMNGWADEQNVALVADAFANESLDSDHACMPTWAARVFPRVLSAQEPDGSWGKQENPVLDTTCALLALAPRPAASGWQALIGHQAPAVVIPHSPVTIIASPPGSAPAPPAGTPPNQHAFSTF